MKFWLDTDRNIVEVTVLRHRQHTADSEVRTADGQLRLAWTLDVFDTREQAELTKKIRERKAASNLNSEVVQIVDDSILIRFAPDRAVASLPDVRHNGRLFYPYTGNRYATPAPKALNHAPYEKAGYYVRYVPANSPSVSTLGRMGGKGSGEVIQL